MSNSTPPLIDLLKNPDFHRLLTQHVGFHPDAALPDVFKEKLARLDLATSPIARKIEPSSSRLR